MPAKSLSGVQTMPPPSAEADAETYARCMKLARQDPHAAQSLAAAWHQRGGAHPADHCAAVALIALGKYKEGATRLQALAQAMTKAPASLRADVLDQEGQAWLLAGDPVRAYTAMANAAVALAPGDPELLIDRAEAAAAAGYFDRAVADLDRVLKGDPNRVDALVYRASAYRALDRLDPARADIDKALAEAPHSAAGLARARQHPPPRRRSRRRAPRLGGGRPSRPGEPGGHGRAGQSRASGGSAGCGAAGRSRSARRPRRERRECSAGRAGDRFSPAAWRHSAPASRHPGPGSRRPRKPQR